MNGAFIRKMIDKSSIFQQAMFDYRRVRLDCLSSEKLLAQAKFLVTVATGIALIPGFFFVAKGV